VSFLGNVVAAVVGAAIAGLLGYIGSVRAARMTAAQALELFDEERQARHSERQTQIRTSISQELQFNRQILERRQLSGAHITLATDAWLAARGETGFLGEPVSKKLLETYSEIRRYNDAVFYELHAVPWGHGGMNNALEDQAWKRIRPLVSEAVELLAIPQGDA
jgi:hypothetical protein